MIELTDEQIVAALGPDVDLTSNTNRVLQVLAVKQARAQGRVVLRNGKPEPAEHQSIYPDTLCDWGAIRYTLAPVTRPPELAELHEMIGCVLTVDYVSLFVVERVYEYSGRVFTSLRIVALSQSPFVEVDLAFPKWCTAVFRRPGPRNAGGLYEWFPVWRPKP